MNIGLIAQPHRTGIGHQTWEFCRAMEPAKVLVTDLARLHADNSRNAKKVSVTDWFNSYDRMTVDGVPDERACKWLLDDIDVLFVVETPLNWQIFNWARQAGVKSVLQVNPEFNEYAIRNVPKPDLFLCPTKWHMKDFEKLGPTKLLPVPIATDRFKRREITKANSFLHITGFAAYMDRNGTELVHAATKHIRQDYPIEVIVHDQGKKELSNYWDLYKEGDVLLLPRRYGGLSLQLQEAAAVGMPIIVTEHDPYASEPCTITIPGPYDKKTISLRGAFDVHSAHPQSIAMTLTALAMSDTTNDLIQDVSQKAYDWARERSWENMKPKYEAEFAELCS